MRQINIAPYQVKPAPYGSIGDDGAQQELTYDVRHSLVEVLFTHKLEPHELLKRDAIARKIVDCPGDELVLEDEEYQKIVQTIEGLAVFGPQDVKFIRRVLNAENVEASVKE